MVQRHGILTLFLLLLFLLTATISAFEEPQPGKIEVTFTFTPTIEAEEVFLAGQFNDWRPNHTKMEEIEEEVFQITIYLEPGTYEYKYVVEGVHWIRPPKAHDYVPDGFGGENGVIFVGLEELEDRGIRGDGEISLQLLFHTPEDNRYFNPLSREEISFRFMTRRQDVEEVLLHLSQGEEEKIIELDFFVTYNRFDYYRRTVELETHLLEYYFQIRDGDSTIFYGEKGAKEIQPEITPFRVDLDARDIFITPSWVQDAIFYQIFPDRFKNAVPENDPQQIELYQDIEKRYRSYISAWDEGVPPTERGPITSEDMILKGDNSIHPVAGYYVFYGGDLQGVEEKIPYLVDLGINAIYFNPIFKASANHRYNTMGYELIDDTLAIKGDQEASLEYFAYLLERLEEEGIRVILDGVFNHVGFEHWAFQDVVERGTESPYVDWFTIHSFPVLHLYEQSIEVPANYDCWWGFGHMPELNLKNKEVREYIWEITKQWMDMGIHGWRLDVPIDVMNRDPLFWEDWRAYVKELDKEAYLTGEIWGNAKDYLKGDAFDGVMNYRFKDAVYQFIGQGNYTAEDFHNQMMHLFIDYPEQAVYVLQNLVGSHDTMRYLTLLDGHKERAKLTTFLKMTYVGAPMIYYGDEIGLEGGDDPDCRRTMIWEDRGYVAPDKEMLEYYKRLIGIRRDEIALRRGWIEYVPTNREMVYGFKREYRDNQLIIFINASEEFASLNVPIDLPDGSYSDIYGEREVFVRQGNLLAPLPPFEGAIIRVE